MSVIINPGVGGTVGARTVLQAAQSYFVSTTGSDITGDGSSAKPWATLQKANSFLQTSVDFGGQRVDLIIKTTGTYTGSTTMGGYVGGGILSIHGATNAPASYVVQDDGTVAGAVFKIIFDTATEMLFDNMTFKPITNFVDCLWNNASCRMTIAGNFGDGLGQSVNMDFSSDVTNANGWIVAGGGVMRIDGTINVTVPPTKNIFTFIGSFGEDDNNSGGSFVEHSVAALTFSNNVRFGRMLAADSQSNLIYDGAGPTFTVGSCLAGHQVVCHTGAIINTFGGQNIAGYVLGVDVGLISGGGQFL